MWKSTSASGRPGRLDELGVLARGVLGLLTRAFDFRRFKAWAQDRLADVAVDDINYTTRSHVDVGSIAKAAAAKIGP